MTGLCSRRHDSQAHLGNKMQKEHRPWAISLQEEGTRKGLPQLQGEKAAKNDHKAPHFSGFLKATASWRQRRHMSTVTLLKSCL